MKIYLKNILPRIKQFSQDLDRKEIFIDQPWVIIDEDMNQQKYIFKRDGELIMSYNGEAIKGTWEYISAAKSLLINRVNDSLLLNQGFIDPKVMVLKKDGLKDNNNLIMANQNLLPNLDVERYLKNIYYHNNRILNRYSESGQTLEIHQSAESYSNGLYDPGKISYKCESRVKK